MRYTCRRPAWTRSMGRCRARSGRGPGAGPGGSRASPRRRPGAGRAERHGQAFHARASGAYRLWMSSRDWRGNRASRRRPRTKARWSVHSWPERSRTWARLRGEGWRALLLGGDSWSPPTLVRVGAASIWRWLRAGSVARTQYRAPVCPMPVLLVGGDLARGVSTQSWLLAGPLYATGGELLAIRMSSSRTETGGRSPRSGTREHHRRRTTRSEGHDLSRQMGSARHGAQRCPTPHLRRG